MEGHRPSQALAKANSDNALMPPPPPPKRIKRPAKVLDEDVYTDALSHIIARDFFPALLESKAQHEYLEALDSNDSDWIREAGRRLLQTMTPGPGGRGRRGTSMTPSASRGATRETPAHPRRTASATPRGWGGATPRSRAASHTPSTAAGDDEPAAAPPVDTTLSLGAFQAKYTSEDNESFNALLDKQNAKRAAKYAFFHNADTQSSSRQLDYNNRDQKLLPHGLASTSAGRNDSTAVALRPSQDPDARSNRIETTRCRTGPRNAFMFAPDGIEDTLMTTAQAAQDSSLAPPRSVSYAATRLPDHNAAATAAADIPPSPSMSAIDAAIAGRPRASSTEPGYSGAETPRVAGYAFVDAEPTPEELGLGLGVPVSDAEADAAEREAALALMPAVDENAGSNPFKLQAASRREALHHRMVDASSADRRNPGSRVQHLKATSAAGAGRTPTPRFATSPAMGRSAVGKQQGGLTPAARMLAARIGRTPGRGAGSNVFGASSAGKDGKKAWTPTPRVKRAT
ncbi:hypothetical protein MBLNU459_g1709t1 [Dothideomycetes sp. NU459]